MHNRTMEQLQKVVDEFQVQYCGDDSDYCNPSLAKDSEGNYYIRIYLRERELPTVCEIARLMAEEPEYVRAYPVEVDGLAVVVGGVASREEIREFHTLTTGGIPWGK